MKTCSVCKQILPLESFHKRATSKDGRGYECKPCGSKRVAEWQRNNREKSRANAKKHSDKPETKRYIRDWQLKKNYGITIEDFEKMSEKQDGKCLICEKVPEKGLHLDHDHLSGRTRGLLCSCCNQGIGSFMDDPEILAKAAKYIENNKN